VRSRIELSDGTTVWLNSGSKIQYPDKFPKGRREVVLEGEAFFDVHSDTSNPFYVDLGRLKVKATGTKFNITNYASEEKSSVYLAEGHVAVIADKDRSEVTLGKLKAGELMVYSHSAKKIVISQAENEKYLGWLQGKLIFRNDYMDQVALRLGRWYNAEIIVEDQELNDFFFTATFRNETLEQALDLLSRSSPIGYTIIPAPQNNDGSFGMRKVIIREKENN
jgi:ferric-dicitrate binding protein FerR (iron transport regulator)